MRLHLHSKRRKAGRQAFLPRAPTRTRSSPNRAAAPPPKMYQAVSWVNRPVKVLLIWSYEVEFQRKMPDISIRALLRPNQIAGEPERH